MQASYLSAARSSAVTSAVGLSGSKRTHTRIFLGFAILFLLPLLSSCASLGDKTQETEKLPDGIEISTLPANTRIQAQALDNPLAETEVGADSEQATPQFDDLWDRLRSGYALAPMDSPYIERHEKWFARNPEYMNRLVTRARLYLFYIVEEVEKRGYPMEIALLPGIESAFKPHAYSRARASGLWQFIPSTGQLYGLERNWWYDGRRDVMAATNAALNYLGKLHKEFDGDWALALAAYNAGEGRVGRARAYNRKKGRNDGYTDLRTLKAETRNYVPKLIALANVIADPEKFGITIDQIPNQPYFKQVDIGSQIDLGILAKKADMALGDLYDINPGFKRWATAPQGPFHLLVPTDKAEAVKSVLETLPDKDRIRWRRHYVRQGDNLSAIGRKYGVGVSSIKRANRLRSNRIRAGSNLLIPISSRTITAYAGNVTRPVRYTRKKAAPPKGTVVVVHNVRKGDTLWGIAVKYGVYIGQITSWNLISRRSKLQLGQKLEIWVKPGQTPTV